jgi:hypothetical protein
MSVNQMSVNKMCINQMPADQMSVNKMPFGQMVFQRKDVAPCFLHKEKKLPLSCHFKWSSDFGAKSF